MYVAAHAIRAMLARDPGLPQVACFDTAMHQTWPRVEQMFALPKELEDEGVRRYGLHGLSYEYIAGVLPTFDARAASGHGAPAADAGAGVDREVRAREKASDHAPVWITLAG